MPLFLDYHQFDKVTIEDVKEAHIADLAIQDEYGVKYHQFWVNEEAATVFCLMEGPDKETCEMVHRMAHGNIACAMTEVKEGFYKLAMGNTIKSEGGMVRLRTGEVDLGYRSMLVVSVRGITHARDTADLHQLLLPVWAREMVPEKVRKFDGREVPWEIDDSMIAVFDNARQAVRCATTIQEGFRNNGDKIPRIVYKIGIGTGQPVTINGDFFNTTLMLSHRLSNAADNNQILLSSLTGKLAKVGHAPDSGALRVISPSEEQLITKVFNAIENEFTADELNIEGLCRSIGISRPQLYRKMRAITGRAPNDFLRDLRLDKARTLLHQKSGNVTEVAYEVGYTNPSYFSKCFTEKFGYKPSAI